MFALLALLLASPALAAPPCNDAGLVYRVCSDQPQAYRAALKAAQQEKRDLLIVFGAEWCVWCKALHRLFEDPAHEPLLKKNFGLLETGLYEGREKSAGGYAVLAEVAKLANAKEPDGLPFLAVIDPAKGKAVFLDTAPLEKNIGKNKGHDPEKVFRAIEAASESLAR